MLDAIFAYVIKIRDIIIQFPLVILGLLIIVYAQFVGIMENILHLTPVLCFRKNRNCNGRNFQRVHRAKNNSFVGNLRKGRRWRWVVILCKLCIKSSC